MTNVPMKIKLKADAYQMFDEDKISEDELVIMLTEADRITQ